MNELGFIALCVGKMLNTMKSSPGDSVHVAVMPGGSVVAAARTGYHYVVYIIRRPNSPVESFIQSIKSQNVTKQLFSTTMPDVEEKPSVLDGLKEWNEFLNKQLDSVVGGVQDYEFKEFMEFFTKLNKKDRFKKD